ncbi:TIGR02281 family clan AA aspartic protease [Albirhodobacter sp. R86504]|uniref:retropepsin-like aspartic protease family protein n=1 Tax=Albirhodobacter sp. R86504 TaxID=3093848 RepID=UPI00366B58BF
MTNDQIPSLIYFVVLLIALGGYVVVEVVRSPARGTRNLIAWGLIFLAVAAGAALWDQMKGGMLSPQASVAQGGRIEIPMARDGHYYVTPELNGVPVRFMVDTGASDIVMSARDAERIGLDPSGLVYVGRAQTANGTVAIAPVRIDRFELGEDTALNIRAMVNEGEMGGSLLGMAYLQRFAKVSFEQGRLILEP